MDRGRFTACEFCDLQVPGADYDDPPPADEDGAWAELADFHEPDCEWIATRAGQRPPLNH